MAIRDESAFLHVPDGELGTFSDEVYAFIKKRMREKSPEDSDKPLCHGCIGTVTRNILAIAARDNDWDYDEFAEMANDLVDRLDDILTPPRPTAADPAMDILRAILAGRR